MIIKQVDNESDPRSYSPNSDFLLNTPYVPIVINETVSPKNESDRCRMLLQAMVYVRVGNYLRTSHTLLLPQYKFRSGEVSRVSSFYGQHQSGVCTNHHS